MFGSAHQNILQLLRQANSTLQRYGMALKSLDFTLTYIAVNYTNSSYFCNYVSSRILWHYFNLIKPNN